ncbi:hypothetical protein MARPO_0127s0042 [Marchantia polymorpha]|uniref:Uncharacterized protein n=1 Tax=Marchantia polymorpha TaxID=3197 RepID=A0A2R6W8T3_MARPO|nr:hypothetical protein MARPO_0127s0042 [Marchantia polymorpha]|eukprot:PTQ30260.1 hypothetical protein MARPO_0127s0042 [Marchantia polymorpha]
MVRGVGHVRYRPRLSSFITVTVRRKSSLCSRFLAVLRPLDMVRGVGHVRYRPRLSSFITVTVRRKSSLCSRCFDVVDDECPRPPQRRVMIVLGTAAAAANGFFLHVRASSESLSCVMRRRLSLSAGTVKSMHAARSLAYHVSEEGVVVSIPWTSLSGSLLRPSNPLINQSINQ